MNSAEIITIGDELLIGQTVDTNSAWMGMQLSLAGVRINRITSIADRREEIITALEEALNRVSLVLITGGLGPTSDDITKAALADYFGYQLVMDQSVLEEITARITRRNFSMNENNRRQALVPDGCRVLANHAGTAPGMLFEKEGRIVISMPGVPAEMRHIMESHVLPLVKARGEKSVIIHRNIMTYGTFEAMLAERLEGFESELPSGIKLAYLPAHGVIKLRLTGCGSDEAVVREETERQVAKLYTIIPDVIYGEGEVTLEEVVGRLLSERGMTMSTAESCTGGRIASLITSVAGCSAWYKGSVVAYDNSVKRSLLGVSEATLIREGAVSEQTAREMAAGMRRVAATDWSVAVTGIAGPTGGTPEKPVGSVWIAIASEKEIVSAGYRFADDRMINISRSAYSALNMLRKQIIGS